MPAEEYNRAFPSCTVCGNAADLKCSKCLAPYCSKGVSVRTLLFVSNAHMKNAK